MQLMEQLPSNPSEALLDADLIHPISHSLISQENQIKIRTLCNFLPKDWTQTRIGFECCLSGQKNWGDFHCLPNLNSPIQTVPFKDPSWNILQGLFDKWIKTQFLQENFIGRVLLEFDVGSSPIWPPKPNICLLFSPRTDPYRVIAAILSVLGNTNAKLTSYFIEQTLAKAGTVDGIGLMLARPNRLRVLFRPNEEALNYLPHQEKLNQMTDYLAQIMGSFRLDSTRLEIDVNEEGTFNPENWGGY